MKFRQFLTNQVSALNALLAGKDLATETKTKISVLRDQYQTALQGLPADEGGVDPSVLDRVIQTVSESMVAMHSAVSGAAEAVNAAWNARVTAGEFVPKEKHTVMLGEAAEAARTAGITEGRTQAETAHKAQLAAARTAADRSLELVRNGLPPAPDDVLALDQPAYDIRRAAATQRVAAAKEKGLDPANCKFVTRYAWVPEEDAAVLAEVLGKVSGTGNPLASGGRSGGSGDPAAPVML